MPFYKRAYNKKLQVYYPCVIVQGKPVDVVDTTLGGGEDDPQSLNKIENMAACR